MPPLFDARKILNLAVLGMGIALVAGFLVLVFLMFQQWYLGH
jgi:hypothetical protein